MVLEDSFRCFIARYGHMSLKYLLISRIVAIVLGACYSTHVPAHVLPNHSDAIAPTNR